MPSEGKNLSDSRGNSLGIGFFKCCMLLFGQRFCAAMVWFVAAFYALFDNTAFNAARPYLHGRFPDAGYLRLRWLFYRMAVAQGQVIVLAHWLRTGHSVPIREYDKDILYDLLTKGQSGLILLISHAGCWQAALTYLESFGRPINLLFQSASQPLRKGKSSASWVTGSRIHRRTASAWPSTARPLMFRNRRGSSPPDAAAR